MKGKSRSTVATVLTMLIVVTAIAIGFIGLQKQLALNGDTTTKSKDEEVDKLIQYDFDNDYPPTAHEVLDFYCRFLKCYYNDKLSEEQLKKLATNNQKLFDSELIEKNPLDKYMTSLKTEIDQYRSSKTTMVNWNIQDASDAEKVTKGDSDFNNLKASFFVKVGDKYQKTYEKFYIREDSAGHWKILFWELTDEF